MGLPKILTHTSYEFLKQQDGYFVRIKVIELNDHLGFPLTGRIAEESGVIVFTNDMDNEIMYIDKVGL